MLQGQFVKCEEAIRLQSCIHDKASVCYLLSLADNWEDGSGFDSYAWELSKPFNGPFIHADWSEKTVVIVRTKIGVDNVWQDKQIIISTIFPIC